MNSQSCQVECRSSCICIDLMHDLGLGATSFGLAWIRRHSRPRGAATCSRLPACMADMHVCCSNTELKYNTLFIGAGSKLHLSGLPRLRRPASQVVASAA